MPVKHIRATASVVSSGESDERAEDEVAERVGVRRQHRMQEDAELQLVGLLEERPVCRVGELAPADVAQEDDALEVQDIDRPVQLAHRGIRIVHRDRRERLESLRIRGDQLGVRVVDHARDRLLRGTLGEEHVRCGEREDRDVDAHPIHVRQPKDRIGHRCGDAEEPRAAVADDPLARGIRAEREVAAGALDPLEVRRRVVMGVNVIAHAQEGIPAWEVPLLP